MDLHEFMMRGVQCGMRYSTVGMSWTRDESCVWGDGESVRGGGGLDVGERVELRVWLGVLEWKGGDIPVGSVGWNGAVEGGEEELRMGESLSSAIGCVWGEWTGGEFDVGYRFGVLVCSVDSGRLSVNCWGG